jgi:large subunit ribosomal protein L15
MHLHELKAPEGARQPKKRVGRGTGSGHGKTSGRGQKGQHARSQGFRIGFEGGQMPLAQRLPKLGGFKNPFKKVYAVVNLTRLNRFEDGATVDLQAFYESGLAPQGQDVKVLGAGHLGRKLTVEAHAFSAASRAAIEAKGGSVKVLGEPKKAKKAKEKEAPKAEVEEPEEAPPSAQGADASPSSGEEATEAQE